MVTEQGELYELVRHIVVLEKASRQTLKDAIKHKQEDSIETNQAIRRLANEVINDRQTLTQAIDKLSERVEVCLAKTKVLPQDQAARLRDIMIVFVGLSFFTSAAGGLAVVGFIQENYYYMGALLVGVVILVGLLLMCFYNRVEPALTEPTLSHHRTCVVAYGGFRLTFNKALI